MIEKSKLPGLYYTSVLQELGEKFHSAPALLKRLNPHARFTAGEQIQVPNVTGSKQEAVDSAQVRAGMIKVVVSKKASSLTVYDRKGEIIFYAPVTSGNDRNRLPIGNWEVTEVQRNPIYNYNPDLFWNADPAGAKAQIAAGPNNPVGVVWIGINDPHYGIHGTPEPGRIGGSTSDGCVRMTNWDASRVADGHHGDAGSVRGMSKAKHGSTRHTGHLGGMGLRLCVGIAVFFLVVLAVGRTSSISR